MTDQPHDLAEIEADINRYADMATGDEYVDNYLKAHAEISAEEAGVRAKAGYLRALIDSAEHGQLSDLERRRKGLDWNHKEPVARLVHEKIQGKKTRHVKTMWGKAGFKTKPATKKLVVFDEKKLSQMQPDLFTAKPILDRKACKSMLEAGHPLRDMAWLDDVPEEQKFYIDTGKVELPAPPKQAALPEKGPDQ